MMKKNLNRQEKLNLIEKRVQELIEENEKLRKENAKLKEYSSNN